METIKVFFATDSYGNFGHLKKNEIGPVCGHSPRSNDPGHFTFANPYVHVCM